ncbi:hypothetical protein V3G39_10480 [Dermatophilaceae bacterium Sec6.4]|nr:hypothetical protein [Actinomycetota bacterium]
MTTVEPDEKVTARPSAMDVDGLRRARAELMGGRGPGADDEEVAAHTRNRVVVAGMSATRRLELAARDTARARGDESQLAGILQRAHVERTHPKQSLGWDHPVSAQAPVGYELRRRPAGGRPAPGKKHVLLGAVGLLIGWGLRRRS